MNRSRYGHAMDEHYIPEFTLARDAGDWVATAVWEGGPVLRDAEFRRLERVKCPAARMSRDLFGVPCAA